MVVRSGESSDGATQMIEEILADGIVSVEAFEEATDVELFPEELSVVQHAVQRRWREFATGRACAREALSLLAIGPVAIPSGPRGEPIWPPGVVGSITHCRLYWACAVAQANGYRTIGIDAEPRVPLPSNVLGSIASPAEIQQLDDFPPSLCTDKLLFSAKEAVFKAIFPLTGVALRFHDANVRLKSDGTFVARLRTTAQTRDGNTLREVHGRWCTGDGLVTTAVTIAA
jgi:4'-phosphopantetheinyl transferase EntD